MRPAETRGRHLTPDEIVARVFPSDEETAPVPLHLAVCAECQSRVAELREGWLLDRGAVAGAVEALPEPFWQAQTEAILEAVKDSAPGASGVHPFPANLQRSLFRHPLLAFGSVAAAVVLVASVTLLKPWSRDVEPARVATTRGASATASPRASDALDRSDDELLRDVDNVLAEETPFSSMDPEGVS
jgi:hypothetical protein